jgi:hypothetical protein
MPIDDNLEEQKTLALEIGQYYCKGFGNTLHGMLGNAEAYMRLGKDDQWRSMSFRWLDQFDEFYSKIPFEYLHGREEFYPLFVIQRLLPILRAENERHYSAPTDSTMQRLGSICVSIADVGRLYDESLHKAINDVRAHPEAKEFRIRLVDDSNREWYF